MSRLRPSEPAGPPRLSLLVMALVIAAVCLPLDAQQRKKASVPKPQTETAPPRAPLTVDEVLTAIYSWPAQGLPQLLESRGVAFPLTPEVRERLVKGGASENILRLIERLASAPPPPPARPKELPRPGLLRVVCSPPECEILVNWVSRGSTESGSRVFSDLPAGPVFVDFRKEGYEGEQKTVTLQLGVAAQLEASLKPATSTLERFGGEMFARMLAALGGEAGLSDVRSLRASGRVTLLEPGGASSEWNIAIRLQLPDKVLWDLKGAGLDWKVGTVGSQTATRGSRSLRGSSKAMELERNTHGFLTYQMAALVERARAGRFRIRADQLPPAEGKTGAVLRLDAEVGSYSIQMGPDSLPRQLSYESAAGAGGGWRVVYGDYRTVGRARYPMTMAIQFAGGSPHGVEIRLTALDPNARLENKDFKP